MRIQLLMICVIFTLSASAQQVAKNITGSGNLFIGFYEYKPTDYNANPTTKYPLIIFLHGIGERGNGTTDLPSVLSNGIPRYINAGHPMRFFWNGKWETFLVLSPQLSTWYANWLNQYVAEMIKYAKLNLRIDTNRVYLAGLSLGGGGTWSYPYESLSNAQQLAAIAPACGTCQFGSSWCNLSNANLPIWAFHAADDGTVSSGCTTGAIGNINACNPAVKPYMTIWPTGNHWIWDRAFDTSYNWQNPNVYEWMMAQDKSLPVNIRPVADAGSNLMISSLTGMANLSASLSKDPDGTLVRYIWKKIAGPAAGSITNPVSTNGLTSITGLTTAGTYRYELKAVDNRADYSLDTVSILVSSSPVSNIPPIAKAGVDQVISTTNITLNGANSYDPDGTLVSYQWKYVSGPGQYTITNAGTATPYVANLGTGTYQFELAASDNLGAISKDTVMITETSIVLPVEYLIFKGTISQSVVTLQWSTLKEYYNDYFDIESSADGLHFIKVGTVKGAGVSKVTTSYQFHTIAGKNELMYYRLKQVNTDGAFNYSPIIMIKTTDASSSLQYQPNPVRNMLKVSIDHPDKGIVTVRFITQDGKVVKQVETIKHTPYLETILDMKQVPPGIYMMEVKVGGLYREIRKVIRL